MRKLASFVLVAGWSLIAVGVSIAGPSGKEDFLQNCARCHGADGKDKVAAMRHAAGYVGVDLTKLSADNGGRFPRQEVYDSIEGSKRFPAHLVGGMPIWAKEFSLDGAKTPGAADRIRQRIDNLVDYIQSLQSVEQ
jgi:mono/diheme cytochrome c family protein